MMRDAGTGDPEYDKLIQEYETMKKKESYCRGVRSKRALAIEKVIPV